MPSSSSSSSSFLTSAYAAARGRGDRRSDHFESFDALFANVEGRNALEKEQYLRLVENIKNAVAREKRRHEDSTWLKYHVIPLSFRGFHMQRCLEFVKTQLSEFGFFVHCDLDRNDVHVYWGHIVPKHVRDAMRKNHGILVDMYGNFLGRELSEEEKQRQADAQPTAETLRKQWEEAEFAQLGRKQNIYDSSAVQSLHQLYSNNNTATATPTSTTRNSSSSNNNNNNAAVSYAQYPFLH